MSRDPRVEAAISHWAPRFVANGVPLVDFQEVTAACERWEDWCQLWSARAAVHEELGAKAAADGYTVSAAGHYTRAAICYHFGKFLFVIDPAQMRRAHEKAVACRNRALPHLSPPGERVAIAYEGKQLYGNLRRPAGKAKAPIVVMCMGLDSAKEEMDDYESRFLARGLATLAFDGPGQGEAEYDFALCPEYERPVKAVIDWLERRNDIDAARLGIWGVSLGGYYAPRAAAFERRIKACVALSGPFARSASFEGRPSINVETFRVRSKSATLEEAAKVAARISLADVAKNIRCPIYIVAGTKDRLTPHTEAERLAREVSGPCALSIIEGGNHVVNNLWYRYRDQTADWMAAQLRV
ncbi:MAG: alpha/beta hydrolase [Betaproteobacteria bacterium]|nr:MAG: alpha/beta hydrolase [Betaproteobacteria bacterium]